RETRPRDALADSFPTVGNARYLGIFRPFCFSYSADPGRRRLTIRSPEGSHLPRQHAVARFHPNGGCACDLFWPSTLHLAQLVSRNKRAWQGSADLELRRCPCLRPTQGDPRRTLASDECRETDQHP